MRYPPASLLAALLLSVAAGCGGATGGSSSPAPTSKITATRSAATNTDSASAAPAPRGYLKEDGDVDGDDGPHPSNAGQDDGILFATYHKRASPAETRAIGRLVKRYYAASAAGQGARACALLNAGLAAGLADSAGRSSAGGTCAASLAPLLAQQRRHLAAEEPATMVVNGVYLKGNLGRVVVGFRRAPEGQINIMREGHAWKINALFDYEMP